jgi:hypothetical protein
MEWQAKWEEPRPRYLQRFDGLLGDGRTRRTFQASIKGILAAGTLICQRIAPVQPSFPEPRMEPNASSDWRLGRVRSARRWMRSI